MTPEEQLTIIKGAIGFKPIELQFEGSPFAEKDPYKILILALLSQRTTERNCKRAYEKLFTTFPTMDAVERADLKHLENVIRCAGLADVKAMHIKAATHLVLDQYSGKVPNNTLQLLELPGVGTKTVAVVRTLAFGEQAVCVDTHVQRISNRLGWVKSKQATRTEYLLEHLFRRELWNDINPALVPFGRVICTAPTPQCSKCPLAWDCAKIGVSAPIQPTHS